MNNGPEGIIHFRADYHLLAEGHYSFSGPIITFWHNYDVY
jgi:hypothetical protein